MEVLLPDRNWKKDNFSSNHAVTVKPIKEADKNDKNQKKKDKKGKKYNRIKRKGDKP